MRGWLRSDGVIARGRSGIYPPPPAQIPACGFLLRCTFGVRTGLLSKVKRDRHSGLGRAIQFRAQAVGDMRVPALCPEHALALALPSTDCLPSTLSAPDPSAGVVRGFTGTMQPSDSSYLPRQRRPSDFLSWPGIAVATAGSMRSPRFRHDP